MVKTKIISQNYDMITSISVKSYCDFRWEWLARGKYNVSSEIKRYQNVTKEDVIRVFNKYIKNRNAVINQVKPKSPFVNKLDSIIGKNPNADLILERTLNI